MMTFSRNSDHAGSVSSGAPLSVPPVPVRLMDVSKVYNGQAALHPTTLEIQAGELLSLLGPSGCGKTTTLRILAGFVAPDTGAVEIGGRDVTDLLPNRRGLGMVFQAYSLFPHMTIGENIAFGLKMRRVNATERDVRVKEMLKMVHLEAFTDRYPAQLSGGQQQRVAIARALITKPSVMLLDEPLGALDKNLREHMQFEIRDLQRRLGITTVLVTHDQEEALTMSDRVAVMSEGRLAQIGSPSQVYERPKTLFVSDFLGRSNIFTAVVQGSNPDGTYQVMVRGFESGACSVQHDLALNTGDTITFCVRPERMRVRPCEAGSHGLLVHVKDRIFRGSYQAIELIAPGLRQVLTAYRQGDVAGLEQGDIALVSFEPHSAVVLTETTS